MLTIINTLTGKKESFHTLKPGKVTLYVCGITPYDRAHIGHGRSYVSFDLLYRWLTFLGNKVTYVRNFTDIDDRLLHKAADIYGDPLLYSKLADKFIAQYQHEMEQLNCIVPTHEPRVTDHIPLIIRFIEDLIKQGHAYVSDGDVYFSIATFPSYGKLSKQQLSELCAGARVEVGEKKKDPLDFALWKKEKEGTFWHSPWGWGRPGWHIECSALASQYVGDHIDIHGGGRDLIFPHHENEIAQSESRSKKPLARYWVHNGLVNINKEKMSKSLGNILALEDIFKQYDPMGLRFYFLLHHYHSPLEFSFEGLQGAQKSYKRLCRLFEGVPLASFSPEALATFPIIQQMLNFLADDLNTTGMFGVLFENLDQLEKDDQQLQAAKQLLHNILGLSLERVQEKEIQMTPHIQHLLAEREKARVAKDFKRADEIRDTLRTLGVEIQDKKIK